MSEPSNQLAIADWKTAETLETIPGLWLPTDGRTGRTDERTYEYFWIGWRMTATARRKRQQQQQQRNSDSDKTRQNCNNKNYNTQRKKHGATWNTHWNEIIFSTLWFLLPFSQNTVSMERDFEMDVCHFSGRNDDDDEPTDQPTTIDDRTNDNVVGILKVQWNLLSMCYKQNKHEKNIKIIKNKNNNFDVLKKTTKTNLKGWGGKYNGKTAIIIVQKKIKWKHKISSSSQFPLLCFFFFLYFVVLFVRETTVNGKMKVRSGKNSCILTYDKGNVIKMQCTKNIYGSFATTNTNQYTDMDEIRTAREYSPIHTYV